MKKVEELCIKYLMNETDPEETAEIRAEMISDSDALIEYESMRSTWSKVKELPTLQPPALLTDAIVDQARQAKRFQLHQLWTPAVKWAAAAAFVGVTAFGAWSSVVNTGDLQGESATNATAENSGQGWVDRNNILYIQPNPAGNTAGGADLYKNSDKLKPVTPTAGNAADARDIRLTGTQRPVNR